MERTSRTGQTKKDTGQTKEDTGQTKKGGWSFNPFSHSQKKNEGLDISSEKPGWEPMVKALKELNKLNDDQQPKWGKIHVKEGEITFFDNEGGEYETLNKHDNPVKFMQLEYKLREHLVDNYLRGRFIEKALSDELNGKEVTGVEKIDGVYKIKCKETTVEGAKTVDYEIKEKDGRYHLFKDDSLVDVHDRVNNWEKAIRDLKLEVRNIHISEELEKAVKGAILSKKDSEGKVAGMEESEINGGQIVDYDKEGKKWTIRTEDGDMHQFELNNNEIEKRASLGIIRESNGEKLTSEEESHVDKLEIAGDKCNITFNGDLSDKTITLNKETMERIESDARIAKVSFTDEKRNAIVSMEQAPNKEIDDLERRYKARQEARKVLEGLLQAGVFVDIVASQGATNIAGGVSAVFQGFQDSEGQMQYVRQQFDQQIHDSRKQRHKEHEKWENEHIKLSRDAKKIVDDKDVDKHIKDKQINS